MLIELSFVVMFVVGVDMSVEAGIIAGPGEVIACEFVFKVAHAVEMLVRLWSDVTSAGIAAEANGQGLTP